MQMHVWRMPGCRCPEAFAETIAGDIVKWDDLAKRANIHLN
jgi:hypothetical protein